MKELINWYYQLQIDHLEQLNDIYYNLADKIKCIYSDRADIANRKTPITGYRRERNDRGKRPRQKIRQ